MPITKPTRIVVCLTTAVLFLAGLEAWRRGRRIVLDSHLRSFLAKTVFYVGEQPVRVLFIIKTLSYLIFLAILARILRRRLARFFGKNPRFGAHQIYILKRAVTVSVYAVGLLFGVWIERIDLTTLAIVAGFLGVAFGLGLQGLVSNLVAGMVLLLEQPIRIGDRISSEDKIGEVVRVGGRSSSIRTDDNVLVSIPNSEFITKQFQNWTASGPTLRLTVPISVAYGAKPQEVIQTLLDVADKHTDVIKQPAPSVLLSGLGEFTQTFTLRVWTQISPKLLIPLRSELYLAILEQFETKGIQLPFSKLEMWQKPVVEGVSTE